MAAKHCFGEDTEVICCSSFEEVIKIASVPKQSDGGIMAIKNSISGNISPNYNLILKSNLKIVGEVCLYIKQHLLVNPAVKLKDIKEVHPHYMAIQQCFGLLDKYNWKLVETGDTALSAKHIHQNRNKYAVAIAGKLVADIYNLNNIASNIRTLKNNYTRFLVLQHKDAPATFIDTNKAPVNFITGNENGSLAKVLTIIAAEGINLSKLKSMLIPGSNFKYSFHADMEFNTTTRFNKLINKLRRVTEQLTVPDIYKNGKI